jgi:hypothetical protein
MSRFGLIQDTDVIHSRIRRWSCSRHIRHGTPSRLYIRKRYLLVSWVMMHISAVTYVRAGLVISIGAISIRGAVSYISILLNLNLNRHFATS